MTNEFFQEYIRDWFFSVPSGIIITTIGLINIKKTIKKHKMEYVYSSIQPYYDGIIGGIVFVIIGILIIYNKT